MKSSRPKVLCEVLFKPMISWVTGNCLEAGLPGGCVVLGHGAELVAAVLPQGYSHVIQEQRLGTGHATSMAEAYLREGGFTQVAVLNGDAPFISAKILRDAYALHMQNGNQATVISAQVDDPFGYGRVVRIPEAVSAIVEEKDADETQRSIREISSGAFWFAADVLLEYFANMSCDNAQGEYYLTGVLDQILSQGGRVGAYQANAFAVMGANDRQGLCLLNEAARDQVLRRHRENGVSIPFSDGIVIGADVSIGADSTILPGTVLRGKTSIGNDCEIGPNSYLHNAVIGNGCTVLSTTIDSSILGDRVRIGPMSNVRPGCLIKPGAKVGDFVELKNSVIGEGTSVAHLTYVGDSDVGSGCNFGCGVVTVNYDGATKHRTVVGNDAFIGCNTNLVAPVRVGNRAYAAAGTTVTEDVPDDALVIGRARQIVKPDWAKTQGMYQKKKPHHEQP